jgi:hypothetical protein
MDLMCPHCQRRVTIPDNQAGQVASCPLCVKQFMAPSLAPPPAPPIAPVPSAPVPANAYGLEPAPAPPPSSYPSAPLPPIPSSRPEPAPPSPPLPPGDYTRSCSCSLNDAWLAFVAPACVLAIFVLSFFSWHYTSPQNAIYLWGLSFTEHGYAWFLAYTILMLLCLPLSIVAMLFDKGWLFTPPQLSPVMPWKNLALGCILGFAFLFLCVDYASSHLNQNGNPIALAMKLAFRLHLIATLASFGMFWLHWRKRRNLPLPKIEVRW